jgi:hypothetical protein
LVWLNSNNNSPSEEEDDAALYDLYTYEKELHDSSETFRHSESPQCCREIYLSGRLGTRDEAASLTLDARGENPSRLWCKKCGASTPLHDRMSLSSLPLVLRC